MQVTDFLPLTPAIKSVTIIASLIILGTIVYLGYEWYLHKRLIMLITLVIMSIVTLATLVIIPRKVSVTEQEMHIRLLAWKIDIPKDDIVKIEHYPHGIDSHRIAGAGGFFGDLGLFDSSVCGKHFSLVTDPTNVCIITRKDKKPIVVSVKDHTIFNQITTIEVK